MNMLTINLLSIVIMLNNKTQVNVVNDFADLC